MTLPDVDARIFEIFADWIYYKCLEPTAYMKGQKPAFYVLLKLYALADRLCVEQLRNEIVDLVYSVAKKTNSILTPSDTFLLYQKIRDSAPIRQLVLDLFLSMKTDRLLEEHPDPWHPQFLLELLVKVKRDRSTSPQRRSKDASKAPYHSAGKVLPVDPKEVGCRYSDSNDKTFH